MNYHHNLKILFEETAAKHALNPALLYKDCRFTYKELEQKSDELAVYMVTQNLSQGDVVAIFSTKAFEDYALMIACLKLGIIYTNIDIDNPAQQGGSDQPDQTLELQRLPQNVGLRLRHLHWQTDSRCWRQVSTSHA